MDIISWVIAVVIAVIAWKFLKGLIKTAFFLVVVIIIAYQIYPYIVKFLGFI